MNDILNKSMVLVLNRNWQAVNVRTPQEAFCMMATNVATGPDMEGESHIRPVTWDEWITLPIRPQDNAVQTVRGPIRVPTVIVAVNHPKVPKKRPKLCARPIRERDGNRCQYTGRALRPDEGSMYYVLPRSRGGKNAGENLVWAGKEVNARKGNRLPPEAGLKLPSVPRAPNKQDRLTRAIEAETRFGVGATFRDRRSHEVMDADWTISPVTKQNKDRAWSQLGTSGSGNHFVEFGLFTAHSKINDLEPGTYVALLSHSGSRGTGAAVCDYYSKIAFAQFPDLPSELKRLAWLSLDSHEGQEYWNAMELMGQYAAANHACIHQNVAENLGAQVLLDLENHHNFAWKEKHVIEGVEREVIVHRKGATPAGAGVLGIIPGSMASPGYVVSGKGNPDSLNSASHGAGRAMSRKAANEKFNWKDVNRLLRERGVTLISAGLDEVPMAYKNIREVMAAQQDLVTTLGQFDPKLVKMAPSGERPED